MVVKVEPTQPVSFLPDRSFERAFSLSGLRSSLPELSSTDLPKEILVGFLRDRRLALRSAIRVEISREEGLIVAEAQDFEEFGFGETVADAIADLQRAVVELFCELEERESQLGADLREILERLRISIVRRA